MKSPNIYVYVYSVLKFIRLNNKKYKNNDFKIYLLVISRGPRESNSLNSIPPGIKLLEVSFLEETTSRGIKLLQTNHSRKRILLGKKTNMFVFLGFFFTESSNISSILKSIQKYTRIQNAKRL